MSTIDYDHAAPAYDAGRSLSPRVVRNWRRAVLRRVRPSEIGILADIGAGTGLWSAHLHRWLEATVVAVEPSAGMRAVAAGKATRGVHQIGGIAESLPLSDACCDGAWLSTVLHHVDLPRCAAELSRVLTDRGVVLIRSGFPDLSDPFGVTRFFPQTRRAWSALPTVDRACEVFYEAGFEADSLDAVVEPRDRNLHAFRRRAVVMRHADTLLAGLTEREFAGGLRRIDQAIERGETSTGGRLDLLVLRRTGLGSHARQGEPGGGGAR